MKRWIATMIALPLLGASLIYRGPMDRVIKSSIVLSRDFSRIAFVAKEGKDKYTVVVDGKPLGTYRGILRGSLRFLGRDLFLVTLGKEGWRAQYKGKRTRAYQAIYPESLTFHGEKFAFVGKRGKDFFVNINGVEFGPYQGVLRDSLKLGKGYFFVVQRGKKWEAIFYGKSLGLYPLILARTITVSPDWNHVAFIADGKPQVLYIDGKPAARYDYFLSQYVLSRREGKFLRPHYGPRMKFVGTHLIFYGVKEDGIYLEKIPLLPRK